LVTVDGKMGEFTDGWALNPVRRGKKNGLVGEAIKDVCLVEGREGDKALEICVASYFYSLLCCVV